MKKQLFISALGVIIMTSCADTFDQNFEVGRPDMDGQYDYLKEYAPLKDCMAETVGAGFHLGIGTAVDDYMKQETVYTLTNSNFNETVAGNAMKMASCVGDDGVMDFAKVTSYVNMATDAGLSVFGHTLAWHSQQPNKWLKSLIANKEMEVDPGAKEEKEDKVMDFSTVTKFPFYVMGYEPDIIDGVLTSHYPDDWHQYFVIDGVSTIPNQEYSVTAMIRASKEHDINVQFGDWGQLMETKMHVTTEWKEQTVKLTPTTTNSFSVFQPGVFDGTIEIKWVKVSHSEAPVVELFIDQLTNGNMEVGQPMDNFIVREHGKSDVPGTILQGEGPDGKNCIAITSISGAVNTHDTQFFITSNKVWEAGEQYRISFWYKATAKAPSETQCHVAPGGYIHWQMLPQNPTFTTEWQHYEVKGTIPSQVEGKGMRTIAFNLNADKENAHTYYFADIHWETIEKGNTIPLTPEEKKDTLIWAMDKWIGGMMAACDSKVKAWDVVNEAVSGGNPDSEGVFALQHSEGYNPGGTWDVGGDAFYWQDFMGDIDYVRTAVALARKHYEANGGTPADLKLFVNDYNLESDWDDNGKVKSLIKWIERWEADGVTKIDGIGTQMHISCYMNPQTQESKKKHITKMFELIAASGKMCRVSELDMGLVDADGNKVSTANVTEEQHKAMAEMYKFVVSEYLRIIPAAQQWGICQWCATDSPAGSGWRANEPVGLWDSNYYRKHTYAGFADGLSGK